MRVVAYVVWADWNMGEAIVDGRGCKIVTRRLAIRHEHYATL
ncbi:MAG: hypothetical protein RLZZ61_239 [Pseudomonadota bacterium]